MLRIVVFHWIPLIFLDNTRNYVAAASIFLFAPSQRQRETRNGSQLFENHENVFTF